MSKQPSNKHETPRKPIAFDISQNEPDQAPNDEAETIRPKRSRQAKSIDTDDDHIIFTQDADDPFANDAQHRIEDSELPGHNRRTMPFLKLFLSAFGLLLSLAFGLWIDGLISDMFARSAWLGGLTLALTVVTVGALLAFIVREIISLSRLRSVERLREDITQLSVQNVRTNAAAKLLVNKVSRLVAHRPETAQGRQALKDMEDEIIDGADYLALAERELMQKLDDAAQNLIIKSAKRVSVVTALSPRALLDVVYVLYEMIRLSRQIAQIYGARPGIAGTCALLKSMAAHLAITGGLAASEDLVHQLLGQSLVSKLSTRFGEGMVNGLMTSRVGIVAMVVARPMPFNVLKQPAISTLFGKLRGFE